MAHANGTPDIPFILKGPVLKWVLCPLPRDKVARLHFVQPMSEGSAPPDLLDLPGHAPVIQSLHSVGLLLTGWHLPRRVQNKEVGGYSLPTLKISIEEQIQWQID